MLCERCKIREATIKHTGIINGAKTERNLRFHCAKEMDFDQHSALLDGELLLRKLLPGLPGLEDDKEENDVRGSVVRPTCRTSFGDFVENSRFGCADCYGVFDSFINDKMKQLQGDESHRGKHPKYRSISEKEHLEAAGGSGGKPRGSIDCLTEVGSRGSQIAVVKKQIKELDTKLKETMYQEGYELVASYRGQTERLKKETGIYE